MELKIKLLPRYMLTFGPVWGLITFIQVELLSAETIKVKGIGPRIKLRSNTTDRLVFHEVFLFKSYDVFYLNPKIIIDAGSNIGLTSIFFANKFPQSKIYSIEPADSNYEILLINTRSYPAIVPIHSALWNKDTSLKIKNKNENHWAFSVEECSHGHPDAFEALSLTSLMKKYNIEHIDILKLDIEGSEKEIFLDNYDYWIRRTRCILIELHDWLKADCSKIVFKTLSRYNFRTTACNGMLHLINAELD